MSDLTDERLADIRERRARWRAQAGVLDADGSRILLIGSLANDVPALLAEIERLRAEVKVLNHTEDLSVVVAETKLAEVTADRDRWEQQATAAAAQRDAVRSLHKRVSDNSGHYCDSCLNGWGEPMRWPCATTRALDNAALPEPTPDAAPVVAEERYCITSGRAVRLIPGDRCYVHGDAPRPCDTALRAPECQHPHLSPNHPNPHCSECGRDLAPAVGPAATDRQVA